MNRTTHLSPLLLVVALSPAFFQTSYSCNRGNPNLLELRYETGGHDRIQSFSGANHGYSVYDTDSMATVSTIAADPGATVTYQFFHDGTYDTAVGAGVGGGTKILAVPAGPSTLRVTVRAPEGAFGTYFVDINPACSDSAECEDGNECTNSGVCDTLTSSCVFTDRPDFSSCDFSAPGNGLCQAGECEPGFCGADPIDCSGAHDCRTDGQCDESCDPSDTCERCVGQNDPAPAGTPCAIGEAGSIGNVCNDSGVCVACLLSENFKRCLVDGGVLGDVCTTNTDCPVTGSGGGICLPVNDDCDSAPDDCQVPSRCHGGSACTGRTQAPVGAPCSNGECNSAGECQMTP